MTFADALTRYFTNVLDVTMFVHFFYFSFALSIITFPKNINRKNILFVLLKFAVLYTCYVFVSSIFFAVANIVGGMQFGGMLFTASFAIIPIIYLTIFTKDRPLHKIIKISVIVASLLIVSEITRTLGIMVGEVTGNNQFLVILTRTTSAIGIPFIGYVIYKFNISRFARLPKIHVAMLLVLAAMLSASAVWENFLNVSSMSGRWLLIFVAVVELFVLVGIYYSIYHLIDYRHRITELEVASSVLAIEKEALEIDIKNREELMKIRHDLRNQLSYTNVLLNEGKNEEAKDYIQSLIDQKEEYIYSFSCPNLVVSGIVNLELTKAKINNKKIKFKVVVPPKLPFEDSDLLSLITNIADNALENFVPQNDKDEINVAIITQQDYLRITCFNSVDNSKTSEKLSLKTTKDGKTHGYGTKIIKKIARKYEGYVTFTFENGKFVCDCLLNMNHRGVKNA